MTSAPLPASNLAELNNDVLRHPADAALPCNLSDKWLTLLARDLEHCVGDSIGAPDAGHYMAAPLAAILHLLSGKSDSASPPHASRRSMSISRTTTSRSRLRSFAATPTSPLSQQQSKPSSQTDAYASPSHENHSGAISFLVTVTHTAAPLSAFLPTHCACHSKENL